MIARRNALRNLGMVTECRRAMGLSILSLPIKHTVLTHRQSSARDETWRPH
jgi:hypothetical protein